MDLRALLYILLFSSYIIQFNVRTIIPFLLQPLGNSRKTAYTYIQLEILLLPSKLKNAETLKKWK